MAAMLLDKATDYGVRALRVLVQSGRQMSSREIAEDAGIPRAYLRLIIARLARSGIVSVREGAAGGIKLGRPPMEIRLLDVVKACQGGVTVSRCMFRGKPCVFRSRCRLRRKLKGLESQVERFLGEITMAELGGTEKQSPNTGG